MSQETSASEVASNGKETSQDERRRIGSPEGVALFLFIGALAAGGLLWSRPLPFLPEDTPGLWLDPSEVHEGTAPESSPPAGEDAVKTADRVRAAGAAERDAAAGTLNRDARGLSGEAARALTQLRDRAGDDAVTNLRNAMTNEAVRGLLSRSQRTDETDALLGAFEQHLERYGARDKGRIIAPTIVIQALFKARWNSVVGEPPMSGLTNVEVQAYWGWLAFEASGAQHARRLDAMDAFEAAGGIPNVEARALLYFLDGRPMEATAALDAAQEERTNLRFRNQALAMVAQAAGPASTGRTGE